MTTDLLRRFDKIYPLSDDCRFYLLGKLKEHIVPHRQYLLKMDTICRRMYFVQEGLIYGYRVVGEKEICTQIVTEGGLCYAAASFYSQTSTIEALQALEDSVLYSLTLADLKSIVDIFPEFYFIMQDHTQRVLTDAEERLFIFQTLDPRGRYEWLLHRHPEFFQRLPVKYLASYIAMTSNAFSKMRSRSTSQRNKIKPPDTRWT